MPNDIMYWDGMVLPPLGPNAHHPYGAANSPKPDERLSYALLNHQHLLIAFNNTIAAEYALTFALDDIGDLHAQTTRHTSARGWTADDYLIAWKSRKAEVKALLWDYECLLDKCEVSDLSVVEEAEARKGWLKWVDDHTSFITTVKLGRYFGNWPFCGILWCRDPIRCGLVGGYPSPNIIADAL
ncbi:MAG: hypothetical protein M1827_004051 [Pycnora praestabilis]|nr:MAG: hypothetical protein M1827_004051 [Pycnora praestabilis]